MNTIYYYPYTPYDYYTTNINDFPELINSFYDLEKECPPHKKEYSSLMDKCPAMNVYSNHTYLIRSPFDFNMKYDRDKGEWDISQNGELEKSLIILPKDKMPYIQLSVFYLFWCNKKCDVTLWQHDPPMWTQSGYKDWYIASGMIPIGEYTRNTSIGFGLKSGGSFVKINRGDVISSITFVSNSKVYLQKKNPKNRIFIKNIENNEKKFSCPMKWSFELFKKWF